MLKYITLFFSVLLLLSACNSSPSGIIPPNEMATVLTDVHLTDGALGNVTQMPDSIYKYGMARYLAIFKKYNIDSAEFNKSYKYYTLHPGVMSDIYDNVLKNIMAKNDSITNLIAKNNTAAFKKGVPATPVGGKIMAKPKVVPGPPTSVKPFTPNNAKRQLLFERGRARRDSMMKKYKEKNVVPVQ